MKIGRNEPCPCGSSKKFKRCCLAQDELQARQLRADGRKKAHSCEYCGQGLHGHDNAYLEDVDELSNQLPELIRTGRIDEAEAIGIDLLYRFPVPDQIDGFERLAKAYEARGDLKKAIDYIRKIATLARLIPGVEPETVRAFTEETNRLEQMVALSGTANDGVKTTARS